MSPKFLQLDLHVDTGGQIKFHQCINRLRGRINNIEHALMRPNFELLAALFVCLLYTSDAADDL